MARQLEILGTSVTVPDPGSVATLAANFDQVSGCLAELQDTLRTLSTPDAWGDWTGQAADAFGQSIGQLPGELGDVQEAYGAVAAALREYASQLEPVSTALTSLSFQADEAEGTLTATHAARAQVVAQGQDPAATGWDARLADATAAVNGLRGQLARLRSELNALSSRCATQITATEPKRVKKSLFGSLASDFLNDVAEPLGRAAEGAINAGGQLAWTAGSAVADALVIHPFTNFVDDAGKIGGPSGWQALGTTLGDVAGILGVLSLVPGVDVVAAPMLLAVSAGAALSDWIAVADHEKGASATGAVLATVSLGLAGTGAVLGKGIAAGDKLIDDAYAAGDSRQVVNLVTGADARVSAGSLLKTGVRQLFSWTDVKASESAGFTEVGKTLSDVKGSLTSVTKLHSTLADGLASKANEFLRVGGDGQTNSPAVVIMQHAQYIGTQAGNAVGVASDQLAGSQPK